MYLIIVDGSVSSKKYLWLVEAFSIGFQTAAIVITHCLAPRPSEVVSFRPPEKKSCKSLRPEAAYVDKAQRRLIISGGLRGSDGQRRPMKTIKQNLDFWFGRRRSACQGGRETRLPSPLKFATYMHRALLSS